MAAALPTPLFEAIAPEATGMPLYRVVKGSLLHALETGRCAPGSTLPSETEIAAAMKVSIGTLRRAVEELVTEHVLVRKQGRGTFVATHTIDRFLARFFHVERSDGLREAPLVELVSFERGPVKNGPAEALGLRIGDPVFQIENRLRLQDAAVVCDRMTLPAALFKGLTEKRFQARPASLYQLYQSEFGITVLRATERARAVAADQEAARLLGLKPGQPVMQLRRTAFTFADRPVEYRVSIIDTSKHDYVPHLSQPASRP